MLPPHLCSDQLVLCSPQGLPRLTAQGVHVEVPGVCLGPTGWARGGMKRSMWLLSQQNSSGRTLQPGVYIYHCAKDSFLVGEECELVVLLAGARHINVFQPMQHRTMLHVLCFKYFCYHKEPAGEEEAVRVGRKEPHRIPITWGYTTAPAPPPCLGQREPVPIWPREKCSRVGLNVSSVTTGIRGQKVAKSAKLAGRTPIEQKALPCTAADLLMGRDLLGPTHLCGLFSQLETGRSSV